jgi:hypothetical protein
VATTLAAAAIAHAISILFIVVSTVRSRLKPYMRRRSIGAKSRMTVQRSEPANR